MELKSKKGEVIYTNSKANSIKELVELAVKDITKTVTAELG